MAEKQQREEEIRISVAMNESGHPVRIQWGATDDPSAGGPTEESGICRTSHDARAFFLYLWDGEKKTVSHIDLWTQEMTIDEMNAFLYHSVITLADAYQRATNNEDVAEGVRLFGKDLGRHLGLIRQDPEGEAGGKA